VKLGGGAVVFGWSGHVPGHSAVTLRL
jgi:hypothetical protein